MKKMFLSLIFLFFVFNVYGFDFTGEVIGITDGDTIKVLNNNTEYKIRLYGIDCPEKSQAYGQQAKKLTSSLCFKKNVRIDVHDVDQYGRLVGLIYVDKTCINIEIVRQGMAWVYIRFCKIPDICDLMKKLEKEARESKKGLWNDPNPINPDEYRKTEKAKKSVDK